MQFDAAKAHSVNGEGEPDGFEVPLQYTQEVSPEGVTRLKVSVPARNLGRVHQTLLHKLTPPLSVLYVQLTDRSADVHHGGNPRRWLTVEQPPEVVVAALSETATLFYSDGRCQLWIRGALGEQLVLDELGLIYVYPDDPAFREALASAGIAEGSAPTMEDRDYVRVQLLAAADGEELGFIEGMGMQRVDD